MNTVSVVKICLANFMRILCKINVHGYLALEDNLDRKLTVTVIHMSPVLENLI